jgi:hypothetical protein
VAEPELHDRASYPLAAADVAAAVEFAVAGAGATPIVLTRVGRELPQRAATVEAFVRAARACSAGWRWNAVAGRPVSRL